MPIRAAVRTSILSRQWRYKWVTLPQLIFDDRCIVARYRDEAVIKDKLIDFIDRVLLLHRGPIEKFNLSSSKLQSCSDIDQWILFLSRNGIKEFIFHIQKGEGHKVPSCLFSCKQLNHLELHGCMFKPPPAFDGFNDLRSLDLQHIIFVEGPIFENILPSCPLLERLTLVDFKEFTNLKIHAPNLKYLHLTGVFKSLCFQNTPLLTTVSIGLTGYKEVTQNEQHHECKTSNLIHVLGCLVDIEKLDVRNCFLKFLAVGYVPNRLPNTYNHLKKLGLYDVSFNKVNELSAVICLIKSSPNLQLLEISALHNDTNAKTEAILESLEAQDAFESSLNQLQVVNITGISGERTELEFIKFLLANAPVLQTMNVELNQENTADRGSRMLREFMGFHRASPKVGIGLMMKIRKPNVQICFIFLVLFFGACW